MDIRQRPVEFILTIVNVIYRGIVVCSKGCVVGMSQFSPTGAEFTDGFFSSITWGHGVALPVNIIMTSSF